MRPSTRRPRSASAGHSWTWRLRVLARAWWGYDFFLSHAHADGKAYTTRLQERLEARDFAVFRDASELHGGESLLSVIRAVLRRTRCLVVVGTRASVDRPWVAREIEAFTRMHRRIVPIDVHRIRETQDWPLPEDVLFVTEGAGEEGPSIEVVERIAEGMHKQRVLVGARRAALALVSGVLLLSLATVLAGWGYLQEQRRALQQEERAGVQRLRALLDRGRRHLPSTATGWDDLDAADALCANRGWSPLPVALAAFVAHRGSRDFSTLTPLSRVPGLRRPIARTVLPEAARAATWDAEGRAWVQGRSGQLYTWTAPSDPRPLAGHRGTRPPGNLGRLSWDGRGLLHEHAGATYRWTGAYDEPVVATFTPPAAATKWVGGAERSAAGNRQGLVWLPGERTVRFGSPVLGMAMHPLAIAVGGGGGRLRVYPDLGGDLALQGHVGSVTTVGFTDDHLLSTGVDGTARLWHWELSEEDVRLVGPPATIRAAAHAPASGHVLTGDEHGTLLLWDVATKWVAAIEGPLPRVAPDAAPWSLGAEEGLVTVRHGADVVAEWAIPRLGTLAALDGTLDLLHAAPDGSPERWELDAALARLRATRRSVASAMPRGSGATPRARQGARAKKGEGASTERDEDAGVPETADP
ncbi:MAG: TIR domain-containing protein [Myxococcota bacterium]